MGRVGNFVVYTYMYTYMYIVCIYHEVTNATHFHRVELKLLAEFFFLNFWDARCINFEGSFCAEKSLPISKGNCHFICKFSKGKKEDIFRQFIRPKCSVVLG